MKPGCKFDEAQEKADLVASELMNRERPPVTTSTEAGVLLKQAQTKLSSRMKAKQSVMLKLKKDSDKAKCVGCGKLLPKQTILDHVNPFSKGCVDKITMSLNAEISSLQNLISELEQSNMCTDES